METVRLTTYFRPPKIAFVVEDANQTVKVMELCTVLWGGYFNEIYRSKDPDLLDRIKESDFIVRCGNSLTFPKSLEDKVVPFQKLFFESDLSKGLIYFDTTEVYQELQKREVNAAIPSSPPKALIDRFRFGAFPSYVPTNYEQAYRQLLKPETIDSNPKRPVSKNGGPHFPIELTALDLLLFIGSSNYDIGTIYLLGDPTNFEDVALAWTLRSRGNQVCFIDRSNLVADVKETNEWRKAEISPSIQDEIEEMNRYQDRVFISSRDLEGDKAILEDLSKDLGIHRVVKPTDFWANTKDTFAYFPRTESKDQMGFLEDQTLTFELHLPPYLENASRLLDNIGVCFELSTLYSGSENGLLHCIPPVEHSERFLLGEVGQSEGARVHGKTVTLFEGLFGSTKTVYLNSPWEFWRSHFWSKDLEMRPSKAGHNVKNIISTYGGIDPGCRVLKLPAVRKVLQLLQNDKSLGKSGLLSEVSKLLPDSNQERGLNFINRQDILSVLCKRGFLRQGYRFCCGQCHNSAWYSLSDVTDDWKCIFCGHQAHTPHLSEKILEFKSNGLFQIAGNAQGALTSLLVLWRFNHLRSLGKMDYIPSFELYKQGGGNAVLECDLLLMIGERPEGKAEVILVEGKSENSFRQEDIDRILELESLTGISCYLCFAATKKNYTSDEVEMFMELYGKHPKIIFLTAQELVPYDLRDAFPNYNKKYILTVEDLSLATIQKHLDPKN